MSLLRPKLEPQNSFNNYQFNVPKILWIIYLILKLLVEKKAIFGGYHASRFKTHDIQDILIRNLDGFRVEKIIEDYAPI